MVRISQVYRLNDAEKLLPNNTKLLLRRAKAHAGTALLIVRQTSCRNCLLIDCCLLNICALTQAEVSLTERSLTSSASRQLMALATSRMKLRGSRSHDSRLAWVRHFLACMYHGVCTLSLFNRADFLPIFSHKALRSEKSLARKAMSS